MQVVSYKNETLKVSSTSGLYMASVLDPFLPSSFSIT